jgi:hypothetical protein
MIGDVPDAVPFERIRNSVLLSREIAVALCRKLRANNYDAHIITPGGILLYEEELKSSLQNAEPEDRVPHQCNGILIVPGNPTHWYIRFPNSAFESIRGNTPDECYQKLIENPRANILMPLAEKYVAPPEHITTPAEVLQALEREKYGNRRMRPGDR